MKVKVHNIILSINKLIYLKNKNLKHKKLFNIKQHKVYLENRRAFLSNRLLLLRNIQINKMK